MLNKLKSTLRPYYYNIRAKVDYYGHKFFCPICSAQLKYFLPLPDIFESQRKKYGFNFSYDEYETINTENYMCPNCSSSDRERLYMLYLQKINFNKKPVKIIDFAPSKNFEKKIKSLKNVTYHSADLYRNDFDLKIDIENIKIKEETYDMLICSHVLEHINSPRKALKELNRITKKGGIGIIMVPIIPKINSTVEVPCESDDDRWKHHGQGDHIRIFGRSDFINLLKSHFDLKIIDKSYFNEVELIKSGINLDFKLYVVKKI